MTIGTVEKTAGYITQAKYVRMQSARELERRLGFGTGRLRDGYKLLFLIDILTPEDFEFRGYTQMSGGIERGHLPAFANGPTAEQRLVQDGFELRRLKEKICRETFAYQGPDRLCKIVPHAGPSGSDDYPAGSGIPQWEIIRSRPKSFKLAGLIGPGQTYTGMYT